ncbi:MAG: putative capsid protein [Cressdnaviricota sp.]|nr:MAG: putative capsid protein [Cressdnaviricota sp.]
MQSDDAKTRFRYGYIKDVHSNPHQEAKYSRSHNWLISTFGTTRVVKFAGDRGFSAVCDSGATPLNWWDNMNGSSDSQRIGNRMHLKYIDLNFKLMAATTRLEQYGDQRVWGADDPPSLKYVDTTWRVVVLEIVGYPSQQRSLFSSFVKWDDVFGELIQNPDGSITRDNFTSTDQQKPNSMDKYNVLADEIIVMNSRTPSASFNIFLPIEKTITYGAPNPDNYLRMTLGYVVLATQDTWSVPDNGISTDPQRHWIPGAGNYSATLAFTDS